jgi:tetratricopeptide (TPR) repeat protein
MMEAMMNQLGWIRGCLIIAFWMAGKVAWSAPQDQQQRQKPTYTLAEYNAYKAADEEKDSQAKIKMLDDFVAKYPTSDQLTPFVYRDYYLAYYALKTYPQTIAYADKLLALPNVDAMRLPALVARAEAYFMGSSSDKTLQTQEAYTKAKDASLLGLQELSKLQKPQNMTDDQFSTQKKGIGLYFNSVAGIAESGLKDYKSAIDSYKAALALDSNDAVTHFRLAVVYLQESPPDSLNEFWELSRSIALKGPGEEQVRAYLRNQLLHYQQPVCDKLVDNEMNEMITLATASADRPASMIIPSADELQKTRDDTANFLSWLQDGGEHGELMWLATCGSEYLDVAVKVLDITLGDNDGVTLKVYRPLAADTNAATREMEAATIPNMEVHIVAQPDAKHLQKNDEVRFTGTLTAYQQSPLLLTWDNAKINAEDLQPAPADGKHPVRPAALKKNGA